VITGFVESGPIVGRQTFRTTTSAQAGGVYLLGSMARQERSAGELGVFDPAHDDSDADSSVPRVGVVLPDCWGRRFLEERQVGVVDIELGCAQVRVVVVEGYLLLVLAPRVEVARAQHKVFGVA
jgi:hypothetical protein